LEDASHLFC